MSRITSDVIDVLKNEQTRVEILSIAGQDPEEVLAKTKLYLHLISYAVIEGDNRFSIQLQLYTTSPEKINTVQKLQKVFKLPVNEFISLPITLYWIYKDGENVTDTISYSQLYVKGRLEPYTFVEAQFTYYDSENVPRTLIRTMNVADNYWDAVIEL